MKASALPRSPVTPPQSPKGEVIHLELGSTSKEEKRKVIKQENDCESGTPLGDKRVRLESNL